MKKQKKMTDVEKMLIAFAEFQDGVVMRLGDRYSYRGKTSRYFPLREMLNECYTGFFMSYN